MAEAEGYARLFDNFHNVLQPKECKRSGKPPSWLKGTMVRNGPGMFEVGDTKYNHWFDGLAYIQRYHFEDGKMYYSARFLESEAYKENVAKNRIVRGSFGTASFPDPCKTLFARFFSHFFETESKHDNANVFFAPVGDGLYAVTETPNMVRIDIDSLDTLGGADMGDLVALHTCTAHQGYDEEGNIYNVGSRFGKDAEHVFTLTKNPLLCKDSKTGHSVENTSLIGTIRCSDPLNPTYLHSFGMSQNYLVLFESPVRVNIKRLLLRKLISTTFGQCLYWDDSKDTTVFIMNKTTGKSHKIKYTADPFFTFHHANSFEKDGFLVLDYCKMRNPGNFDKLLIENMKTGTFKNDPNFLPYLTRLIIPLTIPETAKTGDDLLANVLWAKECEAVIQKDGSVHLTDSRLCDVSFEFPRYHWEKINMKEYRYCYGSSVLGEQYSDGRVGVVKADVVSGEHKVWRRESTSQICGEPIFVAEPNGTEEDDGILIVPVMTLSDGDNPFVLVLSAKSLEEQARYSIPEARIPLGFHAYYRNRQ